MLLSVVGFVVCSVLVYVLTTIPTPTKTLVTPIEKTKGVISVVTSFSVLKDFVQNVGKEAVEVKSIVGATEHPNTPLSLIHI